MDSATDSSLLSYVHPALSAAGVLLAFITLRQGLRQRRQRLRGLQAPAANVKRHAFAGAWAVGLIGFSAVGGVISAVVLRGWKPLGTMHGRLGLGCAMSFAVVWWLGRRLVNRHKHLANRHGLLGLVTLFLGGVTLLLGIELLP